MKTIDTLVEDIHNLLQNGLDDIPEDRLKKFNDQMGFNIKRQLIKDKGQPNNTLRMSNIGSPCERKLWYTVNDANNPDREKLDATVKVKFIYGDLTEEMILFFAELAGHTVEAQQEVQEIEGIKGHMDAIIDGCVVDVKSASTYAFQKFRDGNLLQDDPFGYYTQIMSYLYSSQEDPRVTDKDHGYFLVFDKQLGHICLDKHEKPDWFDQFPEMYKRRKKSMEGPIPPRGFEPIPHQKSGNMKLDTFCSYCEFKKVCYPELRSFIYSGKPVFMTTVAKEPNVDEVM